MICKDLIFTYDNINSKDLYKYTIEDNENLIKIIPEIVKYQQGLWKKQEKKRKDKMKIRLLNLPEIFFILRQLLLDKNNEFNCKIKIQKIIINNEINLKIKIKLYNLLSDLLLKLLHFRVFINIKNDQEINNKTIVTVRYEINSLLADDINTYIENKILSYFITKIDNFIKNIYK